MPWVYTEVLKDTRDYRRKLYEPVSTAKVRGCHIHILTLMNTEDRMPDGHNQVWDYKFRRSERLVGDGVSNAVEVRE